MNKIHYITGEEAANYNLTINGCEHMNPDSMLTSERLLIFHEELHACINKYNSFRHVQNDGFDVQTS